jgi:hypothetical protein
MKKIDAVRYTTKEFKKWVNYTEKNSKAGLGNTTYDSPGPYNMNAGSNNYTVFADYYKQKTGISVQGMPWCFSEGNIRLKDSYKDISDIHPGEKVLSGIGDRYNVVISNTPHDEYVIKVSSDNTDSLIGTPDHPIYSVKGDGEPQLNPLGDLSIGDVLLIYPSIDNADEDVISYNGLKYKKSIITDIEVLQDKQTVYTLTVDGDHTYTVNDVAVHNCDSFVDTVFIHLYGVERAKNLLNGFSAYTPTSAGYFKAVKRWFSRPEPGDIIFFKNSERINHTGYVHDVSGNTVYTVEGNTSSGNNVVVANGGCVALKSYDIHNTRIAGYGRPDYEGVLRDFNPEGFVEGWFKAADNIRWWYQFSNGTYAKNNGTNNGWYKIKNKWYLFDTNGYMLTGHQTIGGQEYYLCEDPNKVEGALMKTDENGALSIWESE